ncbi:element excision factor XisH family protein, partial [Microcoleus sp. Pol11C3]|uniref:element excision factor XisH family protein n=1 Tax=Microcoleus sp. Pol11C3 TaxID=3055390 RepID=UPI002FD2EC51
NILGSYIFHSFQVSYIIPHLFDKCYRIADLEQALGQYTLYYDILKRTESERQLYLAIPLNAFTELFEGESFGQILLDNNRLNLVVFNPKIEEIVQWIA